MNENFWKHDDALWLTLTTEGNFELIEKLQKAFNQVPGFGTIVVPLEGFSPNDKVHNLTLKCLRNHDINIQDNIFEIGNLELALYGRVLNND